jgi:hypothetical protein
MPRVRATHRSIKKTLTKVIPAMIPSVLLILYKLKNLLRFYEAYDRREHYGG